MVKTNKVFIISEAVTTRLYISWIICFEVSPCPQNTMAFAIWRPKMNICITVFLYYLFNMVRFPGKWGERMDNCKSFFFSECRCIKQCALTTPQYRFSCSHTLRLTFVFSFLPYLVLFIIIHTNENVNTFIGIIL